MADVAHEISEGSNCDRSTQFMKLLTTHQPRLYAYISAMLFGDSAAADVLQDTNLHLWSQLDRYDFERPFLPWAFGFARQRVMAHRKSCSRSRLVFSEEALDVISDHCLKAADEVDNRLAALQNCMKRLSAAQAELIRDRYMAKTPVQTIADASANRPITFLPGCIASVKFLPIACSTRWRTRSGNGFDRRQIRTLNAARA